jgi:hypothetical protein
VDVYPAIPGQLSKMVLEIGKGWPVRARYSWQSGRLQSCHRLRKSVAVHLPGAGCFEECAGQARSHVFVGLWVGLRSVLYLL